MKIRSRWIKVGFLILLIFILTWFLKFSGINFSSFSPDRVQRLILQFGVGAPLIYLARICSTRFRPMSGRVRTYPNGTTPKGAIKRLVPQGLQPQGGYPKGL